MPRLYSNVNKRFRTLTTNRVRSMRDLAELISGEEVRAKEAKKRELILKRQRARRRSRRLMLQALAYLPYIRRCRLEVRTPRHVPRRVMNLIFKLDLR
jgi:hypothetical protein